MGLLRIVIALLVVDWLLGAPGGPVETRTGNTFMGAVYTAAFLAALAAFVLTFRGQRFVQPVAGLVGVVAVILAVLDLFGVTAGAAAPAGMVAVDVGGIVVGLAIVWAAVRAR